MTRRFVRLAFLWPALVVAVMCASELVSGQAPAAKEIPRTPWGHPDLQGIWSPGSYLTPLERPLKLTGREFHTDAEVAELEKEAAQNPGRDGRVERGTEEDVEGAYNRVFSEDFGTEVIRTRRTSLIVDPPDGRMPALTPEGEKRRAAVAYRLNDIGRNSQVHYNLSWIGRRSDNPEDRLPIERCLGVTAPFIRGTSGTLSRIVQAPDAVTFYYEDGHHGSAYRTVPVDGRPHLAPHVRQWLGDSRGRWEGDTLVVDTTNFTDRTTFNGSRENLHLVERYTRTAPDLVMYRVTVEDPATWVRPWTVELPLTKRDNKRNQIYEALCHEGNYAMTTMLAGARMLERSAAAKSRKRR